MPHRNVRCHQHLDDRALYYAIAEPPHDRLKRGRLSGSRHYWVVRQVVEDHLQA